MSEKPRRSFLGGLFGGGGGETGSTPRPTVTLEEENSQALPREATRTRAFSQPVNTADDTLENYQNELKVYENHRQDYAGQKTNYDKILTEYSSARQSLEGLLADFTTLATEMKNAKGLYDVDYKDYTEQKASYEEVKSGYEFATQTHSDLLGQLTQTRADMGLRDIRIQETKKNVATVAEEFEASANAHTEKQATVDTLQAAYNELDNEKKSTSSKFDDLAKDYDDKKPGYDQAKARFEYAEETKGDFETLTEQNRQMTAQVEVAKANYDEIKAIRDEHDEDAAINEEIDSFTHQPLATIDDSYQEKEAAFSKLEAEYTSLKERYEQESANFARIEKNYNDLKGSENANRVALHYVSEEYTSAKDLLSQIREQYLPIEKDYNKEKQIFEVIHKNYVQIKDMADEAARNREEAQQKANDAQETYDKVEEAYNFVHTQSGILQQNLATKEAQYKEIADDYDEIVAHFNDVKTTFEPLSEEYQKTQEKLNLLTTKLAEAESALTSAQSARDAAKIELNTATEKLAAARAELDGFQSEYDALEKTANTLDTQVAQADDLSQKSYATAQERYATVSERYGKLAAAYESFNKTYESYSQRYDETSNEHARVASLYRLADDEYKNIEVSHSAFLKHGQDISNLYDKVMAKYTDDKAYYDKVYAEYTKLKESQNDVEDKKRSFDLAAQKIKTILVQDNSLTFPIYEATGQNYVDAFNLPEVEEAANGSLLLKNKPQLSTWSATFKNVRNELATAASLLSTSLNVYETTYNHYLEVGGDRLKALGNDEKAYEGIDLAHYISILDEQAATWQDEYSEREAAFAPLANAYRDYLERERQLLNLVTANASAQDGVQAVINVINSIPDYTDMYSTSYGDLNSLASLLGIPVSEMTKPKDAAELRTILTSAYYDRAHAMIASNVSAFTTNLNNLRANYEASLDNLKKQLGYFTVSTGIPTSQIELTGVLNDSIDLAQYFETGLKNNMDKLSAMLGGVSSLVNVIRKSGNLSKVANRTIDASADSTLVLPDKPVTMSQDLLVTDIVVHAPKSVPIPVEPAKPTDVAVLPTAPVAMPELPARVERVEAPEEAVAI